MEPDTGKGGLIFKCILFDWYFFAMVVAFIMLTTVVVPNANAYAEVIFSVYL
jgi:hypothetical protein